MVRSVVEIRRAWRGAVLAPLLMCAVVSVANARQSSTAQTTSPKTDPAKKGNTSTAKKTTPSKSTAHPHHSTAATPSGMKKSSATVHSASGKRSSRKKSTKMRGQQKIDSERAQAIQEALIREHYLSGDASGTWNQASEDAMRKYQADHGWQSKTVPDSRALIKLGLGPSKDHLLNPQSAMTTIPDAPRAEPVAPVSHTAAPAASDPIPPAATSTPAQSDSPSPQ